MNKENNIPVSFFYDSCKNLTLNDESESESGKFYDKISENIKSESKYYPNILGSTPKEEGDISIQHYFVDQGNYILLKSKSEFLNVKIVLIFFLLFCLMF